MQKYQVPKRASAGYELPAHTTAPPVKKSQPFLRFVLLTIALCLCLFLLYTRIVLPWWQGLTDQWHYGDNRVTVFDGGDMGHGGDSQLIALVWQSKIVVIEVVDGRATTYNTIGESLGAGHSLVLLSVADINGDGKPDVLVHVEGTDVGLVLYNTGTGFSLTKP